jgi:hypothetical protein
VEGGTEMSCPYLEKGKTAYCHAFGGERLGVVKSDNEGVCFSGEFSECSFLFSPISGEYWERKRQRNIEPGPFQDFILGNKNSKLKGTNRE